MRSVQLLVYKAEEGILELRAREYSVTWMVAVEVCRVTLHHVTRMGQRTQMSPLSRLVY